MRRENVQVHMDKNAHLHTWVDSSVAFFFFALFKCIILLMVYLYVRTSSDLEPKTGLGSNPTRPNNKFVEREKKN